MSDAHPDVCRHIVCQIVALEACRRVWVAQCDATSRYRTMDAPTQCLPEFRELPVAGLVCAETVAGKDRVHAHLGPLEPVAWREVSIRRARTIARQMAVRKGLVVHLALFDDPHRVVWEPVAPSS